MNINNILQNQNQFQVETIDSFAFYEQHKIFETLLRLLANKQIRSTKTGVPLPCILHERTKIALQEIHSWTPQDIEDFEAGIFSEVESGLSGYEVTQSAPMSLYRQLQKEGREDLIFDRQIVPVPNAILNALACTALEKRFTRTALLSCDGFVEVYDDELETSAVRLDVDEHLSRQGFIVPIKEDGLVSHLQVFRHPRDERPFRLRSRSNIVWRLNPWQQ